MGKNQQKTTFNDASGLLNALEPSTATGLNTANAGFGTAAGSYGSINPVATLAPATAASTGIATTGGYSQPQLNTLESAETTNLGGLDPSSLAKLSGQYQDLISSGGISDATAAAMQRQATSGVKSLYGTLGHQLDRTRSVTGGQGGGGETAQLARQLGQAESDAVTGVNAEVGRLRQQGTEAGLAGASNLQAAQAAARDAAARTFSGTQSGIAAGRQIGAGQLGSLGGETLGAELGTAGGLSNLAGLESRQYLGQLGGQEGLLGIMANIGNNQPNWYQSLAGGTNAITGLLGSIGGAITGAKSGGVGGALGGL